MQLQEHINYHHIAEAIENINNNLESQPALADSSKEINSASARLQKMLMQWAGTSPEKILQYMSQKHLRKMLQEKQPSLFDTTFKTELSTHKSQHDLFISTEVMSAEEYKNAGKNLHINYSFAKSPFGKIIVASTNKGICYMAFEEDENKAFTHLKSKFPVATYHPFQDAMQENALLIFQQKNNKISPITLHLKGSHFQLKVWDALLNIPFGRLTTYGNIAAKMGSVKSARAVGTAIGSNPVAYLIPCHRVIHSTGAMGGYRWHTIRKAMIIAWECAKMENKNKE